MTDTPYTDADIELAARAISAYDYKHHLSAGGEIGPHHRNEARAALAALAAAGRLAPVDDDPRHIIEFRPGGWTLKHPLACRPDLFRCPINVACEEQVTAEPATGLGRYVSWLDDIDGRLVLGDRVDQEATPPEGDPADAEADQVAVQNLLDDATRAFADAGTSGERVEVIRDLLAGWYAAWPASAVTDEHEGIAHQLVALVYAAEARAAECPCLGGAPKHRHGVGGYAPHASPDNPAPAPADPEAASRVITAAEALERRLWTRGLTEDDMTPEHRELAQALASYNSFRAEHSVEPAPHHHVIAFAGDGTWTMEHPAAECEAEAAAGYTRPTVQFWDCQVRRLAERQITPDLAALVAGGRYECEAGDLGDLFQLIDRLHDNQCTPPPCTACGCWCHAEEQTEG